MSLYPLKFETIYKDKIWGGDKIKTVLNKDFSPLPNCGETWEISGIEGNISKVSEGNLKGSLLTDLIHKYGSTLLGKSVEHRFGAEFPLLIKFIDAKEDLSIQVHPNDKLAKSRHNSFGKTEMWYIFQADKGSSLISGFNQQVDKEIYQSKFNSGHLTDILSREEVEAGDVFFIPAGRVHTIGAGVLLTEIQQTSDVTYRIYDFDRKDDKGNLRELHTEEALDAITYEFLPTYKTNYSTEKNKKNSIVSCGHFETNKYQIDAPISFDYSQLDSFRIFICYKGKTNIKGEEFNVEMKMGDAVLIPACISNLTVEPLEESEFIETYIPS
jgi:mannose-6-phosphate isomerase